MAINDAEFILARLKRATEQNISWLEEAGEDIPAPIELPLVPDYRPAA